MTPRKLEHGFRMISAGILTTLPQGDGDGDVPTFRLRTVVAEYLTFNLWGLYNDTIIGKVNLFGARVYSP